MPYGTASKETISLLSHELQASIDGYGKYRVDVVISGALDESFNVLVRDSAYEIALAIFASLAVHRDLEPGEDFEVSFYDDRTEPPELYWEARGRRLENNDLIDMAIKAAKRN